jgi:nicotinate-nucleotide pyrophosphorylase (carboxylating)
VLPSYITSEFLKTFVRTALQEDVGEGDHSTLAAIEPSRKSKARLLVKGDGVLAGVYLAEFIFKEFDANLTIEKFFADGDRVRKGDVAFIVTGPARSILTTERVVLNCMQRMSGIATKTANFVKALEGTTTKILDTRKTTPNFRHLEKWAVKIGGGNNHRLGLFDLIMLKDNHCDMAGGITQAVDRTKEYLRATNKKLKIEVETRNLAEVKEALATQAVDIIMLDNMDIPTMNEAVRMINKQCQTEASGGITEDTLREIAMCGVDYISVGALTHSYQSLDLSLKAF